MLCGLRHLEDEKLILARPAHELKAAPQASVLLLLAPELSQSFPRPVEELRRRSARQQPFVLWSLRTFLLTTTRYGITGW